LVYNLLPMENTVLSPDIFKLVKPKITTREMDILKLIATGHSNTEIASQLFLSSETIKTHRSNLMRKLNARNAASMVARAFQKGLMSELI